MTATTFGLSSWVPPSVGSIGALAIRAAACLLPVSLLGTQGLGAAVLAASSLGAADGCARSWLARSASSLHAQAEGLRVGTLLESRVIPWSAIRAVQFWPCINRISYLLVHFTTERGVNVASCWDPCDAMERDAFIRECARRVGGSGTAVVTELAALEHAP